MGVKLQGHRNHRFWGVLTKRRTVTSKIDMSLLPFLHMYQRWFGRMAEGVQNGLRRILTRTC